MSIQTKPNPPDGALGNFYVDVVDPVHDRVSLLYGPFVNDHAGALAAVDMVRRLACDADPRAWFDYSFGTCRTPDDWPPRPGVLNHLLPAIETKTQ